MGRRSPRVTTARLDVRDRVTGLRLVSGRLATRGQAEAGVPVGALDSEAVPMMSVLLGLLIPPAALLVILILSWFEDHVLTPPGGYPSASQEAAAEAELSGEPAAVATVDGPAAGAVPEPEPEQGRTPRPLPQPLPAVLRGRPWRDRPASGPRPGYRPPLLPDTGAGAQHHSVRALRR